MIPVGVFRALTASFLRELPRIILAALFSFAAIDKLIHFRGFVTTVQSYRLLPAQAERYIAIFFIMAEFVIAFGLLTRRWRQPACLAAVLLLATITTVYLAARPAGVCGGWFTLTLNTGEPVHILQNLIFMALAVLTWVDNKPPSLNEDASSVSYSTSHSTAAQEADDGRLKHAQ